ncbi:SIR2 family protein [Paramagnetospirillum caucaseum]|uniref:SIR2 family protein n=1 Tax=Paramagnetospirillum caucaseum TaxID=1244869 RepID=UPI0013788EFF|nr:SIR2 family protein [Paramagnetospirillum caucaseum]
MAALAGGECEPSPQEWYCGAYGKDPDYSELLDALAKTPAERQQLLRTYWEPTDEEREEGAKAPTPAHRAIASMVSQGFIKVIITTNFDRLMETALSDIGVVPTVLSTPDQVHGTLPLIHTKCCVFKVHGDYLDTRIKNTPSELETYPHEFDAVLDRIFDDFGLIVCGWSADWDEALRKTLIRCPSRRFAMYWAARGEPSESARKLIDHRSAHVIPIRDADTFLTTLQAQVESLEQFARPHPLSTEAAVASLKRYLSEPKYRIQLFDLIDSEVGRIIDVIRGQRFPIQGGDNPDGKTFTARVRAYEAACGTLLAMGVVGGYWADATNSHIWKKALAALGNRTTEAGYIAWIDLQRYPATLLTYSLGIGAVEGGNLEFLGELFGETISRESGKDHSVAEKLPPFCLFQQGGQYPRLLEGMDRRHAPMNDWLQAVLRPIAGRIISDDQHFLISFDKLEMLLALSNGWHSGREGGRYWVPPGAYGYRHENCARIVKEFEDSIVSFGDQSPLVRGRIFGASADECSRHLEMFKNFIGTLSSQWW